MSPQGYKNMDLESQDPIFNVNLGQDENIIWTKKLRCSHSITLEISKQKPATALRRDDCETTLEVEVEATPRKSDSSGPPWPRKSTLTMGETLANQTTLTALTNKDWKPVVDGLGLNRPQNILCPTSILRNVSLGFGSGANVILWYVFCKKN